MLTQLFLSLTLALPGTAGFSARPDGVRPAADVLMQTDQTAAQARMRFRGMDRNNDGEISREEWRGSDRSFENHDWNGDGRLSGDEVRAGVWSDDVQEADHDPSRAERYLSWTERGFASLDHNRDRRITANEWHFDRESFLRADRNRDGALDRTEFLGGDFDDDRDDRFDDLDADGDNRIERDEWHASDDAFEWLDRNGDGVLTRVEVTGSDEPSSSLDQFASLDYDENGRITRDEWHWSRASFDRRDLNGDGALTRREFSTLETDDDTAAASASRRVTVSAREEWTDTGLVVREGDTLAIQAQGTVRLSPDTGDSATPAGSRTGRRAPDAPAQAPAGALIGRIGSGEPFVIGDRRTVTIPASGRLYLSVNDDHFADNSGTFQVTIAARRLRN